MFFKELFAKFTEFSQMQIKINTFPRIEAIFKRYLELQGRKHVENLRGRLRMF